MGNNISFPNYNELDGLQEELEDNGENKLQEELEDNEDQILELKKDELKFHREQLIDFIRMLEEDKVLEDFLIFDRCCVLADKYLLAMCFVYFVRAGLQPSEFVRMNFFSALYLAHKMEEDDKNLRRVIFPWACAPSVKLRRLPLLRSVRKMWKATGCRLLVSQFSCKQVMQQIPEAFIWSRHRPENHGNAYKVFQKCTNCVPRVTNKILDTFEYEDDIYLGKPRASKRLLLVPDMQVASDEDVSYLSPTDDTDEDSMDENSESQSSPSNKTERTLTMHFSEAWKNDFYNGFDECMNYRWNTCQALHFALQTRLLE
ncbi:hypothetical protein LSTR_LSTR009021 [Laodelphax striatellus]|uniref:Uncharacterized protein n=1 Tax=Laodelphax striatellus TaxID=195883 RepID=A0A482XC10_LAOST|nr:hypothetical protein LSTR_LSTR009021 [Laodelphax striatellus]